MAAAKVSALLLGCLMMLSGCTSARQLQQQAQQPQVDLGGLVNQIGQVASQGIQSVLQTSNQNTNQASNGSRPLGSIGDALQNLGASLNNRTGTTTGTTAGATPGPSRPPAGRAPASPAPQQDSTLLADPTEITQNVTSGLSTFLGNLTSGLANATAAVTQQQQQQEQKKQEPITPPPGIKSSAGSASVAHLAGLAAAAVVLVQLMA